MMERTETRCSFIFVAFSSSLSPVSPLRFFLSQLSFPFPRLEKKKTYQFGSFPPAPTDQLIPCSSARGRRERVKEVWAERGRVILIRSFLKNFSNVILVIHVLNLSFLDYTGSFPLHHHYIFAEPAHIS